MGAEVDAEVTHRLIYTTDAPMVCCGHMWNVFMHDSLFAPAISGWGLGAAVLTFVFLIIALWSLVWKALAMWHAAKNRQRIWFIVLLLVNTVGVLEIIYLAWFAKDSSKENSEELLPFLKTMNVSMPTRAASAAGPAPESTPE